MGDAGTSSSVPTFEQPKADSGAQLAAATVGLVTKAEFTRRREEIEQQTNELERQDSTEGKKGKKKKKKGKASTLSFGDEEEEEAEVEALPKKAKFGKNPSVDTSMLFDAEREAEQAKKKEQLAREWKEEQDQVKAEKLQVTYSYHDPSGRDGLKGHRNEIIVQKGFTIEQFLNKCREQVKDLRGAGADQLIYVKEDLIMPHSLTFYELIVSKARGKVRRMAARYARSARAAPGGPSWRSVPRPARRSARRAQRSAPRAMPDECGLAWRMPSCPTGAVSPDERSPDLSSALTCTTTSGWVKSTTGWRRTSRTQGR